MVTSQNIEMIRE